ncbi:hypothetical protein LPJ77_001955 [Coemansia sp. RSA 2523]|nr:hypothetical protein LPJ77_001955 [Coemansia sp. RSA 2523]KAJ2533888.1 hypothetical protein GGH20_000370 [Coemansia sp. RSA 1937]
MAQPNHTYGSHGDSLVGSASTGAEASGYNASGNAPGRKSGERRRRKSSTYAMNIDPPNEYQSAYDNNGQQSISTYQSQVSGRSNDYYAYATTTAQMVDPWAFNHANLLANLSQLPPDLLPSLLPQMQLQQPGAPSMAALAAAAAVAAANVVPMNTPQQQMHADRQFAAPAVPLHRQTNGAANTPGNVVLPPISNFPQPARAPSISQLGSQRYEYVDPANSARQQQMPAVPPQYVPQNGYSGNMYYAAASLQPLMLPPPSPTILSYYTADPTQWMSLLGQNAYQPQAYHYDYPLPPHQLPYNFPSQQQPSAAFGLAPMQTGDPSLAAVAAAAAAAQSGATPNGPGMLLTQQYAPHQQAAMPPVSLPPIGQAINQSNLAINQNMAINQSNMAAAAAAAQIVAAAAASGQYTQPVANGAVAYPGTQQPLQFDAQGSSTFGPGGTLPQQQLGNLYQPSRRASSFTNLALLQQQQPSSFGRAEFRSQAIPKAHEQPESQYPSTALLGNTSMLSTFQPPQQARNQQIFGAHVPSLAPVSNRYSTSTGAYGTSALNAAGTRPQSYSGTRPHGNMSSMSRISLANKVRHDVAAAFGGTKPASQTQLNTTSAAYLGSGLLPASSAAIGREGDASDFVPGTCVRKQNAASEAMRDRLLQTAHQMYSGNARSPVLIEMLLCLHELHPRHLPTLLLLACAYFSSSQPAKSLEYNKLILKIDPNYVEAMSNIGTTLRSMGRASDAEVWWWRAVKLRPGYWDAVENLMGVLCNAAQQGKDKSSEPKSPVKAAAPRYREALELCEFVDKSLCTGDAAGAVRTYQVQDKQLHRLQSLLYSEGNLRFALGDVSGARREYEKAMEAALGGLTLDEVVVRIASAGAQEGINQMFHQQLNNTRPPTHNLRINSLPLTLLAPENAVRILQILFPETQGVLPGFVALAAKAGDSVQLQQANQVASNLLLTLAKLHQDHAVVAQPLTIVLPLYYMALALVPSPSTCNNLGIILSAIPSPSTATMVPSLQGGHQAAQAPMGSALAMQYYTHGLTLDSRHPHLYTNLGSLLKDLGYLAEAVRMYEQAVKYNETFDVALANLGNAIKDMGRVQDSIQWYLKAVRASPNFVEAVCGLANAMAGVCDWRARDGLYTEIAVRWRGAALANDDVAKQIFHVMSRGRRPTAHEYAGKLRQMIGYASALSPRETDGVDKRRGWMNRVVEIVDQQLSDGRAWARSLLLTEPTDGVGIARPTAALIWFLDGLCRLLPQATLAPASPLTQFLHSALALVREVSDFGAEALPANTARSWAYLARQVRNEGGWAMRLVERAMIVLQRQWYWDVQQRKSSALDALTNPHNSVYQRPALPTGMVAPLVPTVLPFHTFTYPLDAREIRLISHRNAMRLSFTTLGGSAPWLPAHLYAPPPPPSPHIRIGYVSSDFNNHPLSHLMQSVFGMHDRSRFRVYCYATTPSDGTVHRQKIEAEADVFLNCAAWSTQRIVEQIAHDKIHVLVNLNGYTKGARNEIFAARPAPVLVAFMGFAGTLGAGWCDYVVTDPIVCPPWTVRSEVRAERRRRAKLGEQRSQPEMQEVGRHEMVERTASMAISDSSDSEAEANIDSEHVGAAGMGRAGRQGEWAEELPWDFGELDPEEDGLHTNELADTHRRSDEAGVNDWVYTERMMYMPHTYFVNDHRQGFREDEELREVQTPDALWLAEQDARYKMRRELFPQLSDDVFIFANFNQLYKIDPTLFRLWLRILERVPNAIIWLLRFPAAGEEHLHRVATEWAGPDVARRVVFTDVAPKHMHIKRGRIADAFLDTTECNAHTTAVDILWSGTPVLTWPRHEHKLCSRVAASVVCATGQGRAMVVSSADEYVDRAVEWATQARHEYTYDRPSALVPAILEPDVRTGYVKHRICHGPTMDIRLQLFMARDQSRLFDTHRWTRNLERGFAEAWRRWVTGEDEADDNDVECVGHELVAEDCALDKQSRRKAQWSRRIEQRIADGLATATREQRTVYAPRGGSIWILDEDDGMPAQTWVREMLGW